MILRQPVEKKKGLASLKGSFRRSHCFCLGASLLLYLTSASSQAAVFSLPELDTTMTGPVFQTLAGAVAFRSVEPAADLGARFGFYIGTAVSIVDTSAVTAIFSDFSLPYLPSADIQIGIGAPYGLTLELGVLPSLSYQGTTFGKFSGGIRWTATRQVWPKLPFSLAFRVGYTSATLSYEQSLNSTDITVDYGASILSGGAVVSKRFAIFEPYLGLGIANHTSTLSSAGSVSLFGNSFPVGTQSQSLSQLAIWPQAGLMIHLVVLGISAQYDNLFGLTSYSAKVSLRF